MRCYRLIWLYSHSWYNVDNIYDKRDYFMEDQISMQQDNNNYENIMILFGSGFKVRRQFLPKKFWSTTVGHRISTAGAATGHRSSDVDSGVDHNSF
ncbi:hypothetical protein MTR_5g062945 [Medicago truncatula]|uniref:Uncharacterized protein n=1 Tax=Medicago truncatula TaxID=3880 RepID=A0A072UEH2_MEDTR|nr:hypothetical protein MTR_5g062945 [Medicago truncatula]